MSKVIELGNIDKIHIQLPKIEITKNDVLERIELTRKENLIKVETNGPIKKGDTVYISFTGKTKDGEDFPGNNAENIAGQIGSGDFIKEFDQQLIGYSKGENLIINVTPEATFHIQAVANCPLIFNVTINKILTEELPVFDNFFVNTLKISNVKNVDDFYNFCESAVKVEKLKEYEQFMRNQIINKIVGETIFVIDDEEINQESDKLVKIFEQKLFYQGLILEEYLLNKNITREDLINKYFEEAKKYLKVRLLMDELKDMLDIELTDEQLIEEAKLFETTYGLDIVDIIQMSPKQMDKFRNDVTRRKIMEILVERTIIEYI